ncbi:MAG: hypothetical protein ABIH22_01415 [Candidatus Margulisiibacteriota bacterium]
MLLLLFLGQAVFASYISLDTTVTSKVEKNELKVLLEAVNKGDESAYNVQAEIRAGDDKFLAQRRPELGIDQTYKAYATFKLGRKKPGQYPLVLVMHYTDANQYPFSAMTCQTYSSQAEDLPSEIFGRIKSKTFWKEGRAKLTLKNMGDSEIAATTYLVVPREITVAGGPQKVTLLPKSQKSLDFPVENFSALSGSNYQIFAIAEYEKQGMHQTSISPGMIRIVEKNFFRDYRVFIVALVAFLLAAFILLQRKKK